MRTVRLDKNSLLVKVKTNRENHRRLFEAAQEGYRDAVIAELDRMLADAKAGRRVQTSINLPAPVDQTREYDRVIAQLEMEVRSEVELTDEEFANYVMDQWRWSAQVMGLAMTYADEAVVDHNGLSSFKAKKFR